MGTSDKLRGNVYDIICFHFFLAVGSHCLPNSLSNCIVNVYTTTNKLTMRAGLKRKVLVHIVTCFSCLLTLCICQTATQFERKDKSKALLRFHFSSVSYV
jgi:hypothetical protein